MDSGCVLVLPCHSSCADLIKMAMCAWSHLSCMQQQQQQAVSSPAGSNCAVGCDVNQHCGMPPPNTSSSSCGHPARLLAQIHDELLFECDADPAAVQALSRDVRRIMCGVAELHVPLVVKMAVGPRWGRLQELIVPPTVATVASGKVQSL